MSNALKALESKNNPQEEVFPRKAKWDWTESNEKSQDEDSEDDVEMWGKGYKKQEIESDNELTTFSEEDDDEYDNQSDDNDDQSEGGDDQSDESEDDDYDDNDDNRYDIKYMRGFGDIKFVGDKIYKQKYSELGLDNDDIEIDG